MSNHPRVLIKDLSQNFEKTVCIKGFVDSLRDQKKFVFLILRDGSGQAQIFCDKNGKFDEILEKITPESTLEVTGKVVKNESVKLNGLELIPEEIKILYTKDRLFDNPQAHQYFPILSPSYHPNLK